MAEMVRCVRDARGNQLGRRINLITIDNILLGFGMFTTQWYYY